MNPVLVVWDDIHSVDPWQDIPKAYEPYQVQSLGYLVVDAPEGIVLCSNIAPSAGHCFGQVHIPRGCIVSIETIGP